MIGVSKLSGAFAAVKKAGGAAKLAIAALTSPVGIVIGTIMGLIAVVLIVRRHIDVFKKSLSTLSPVFHRLMEKYRDLWKNFKASGRWYRLLFWI